jgi:hypothetical protein
MCYVVGQSCFFGEDPFQDSFFVVVLLSGKPRFHGIEEKTLSADVCEVPSGKLT